MTTVDDKIAALSAAVKPKNLKELKHALAGLPDEHLEKYIVFRFCWGDLNGFQEWKRDETPKQYWKRMKGAIRGGK